MKYIISLILLTLSLFLQSQVHTFQSTSYAYKVKTGKDWGNAGDNWSKKTVTKVNITVDFNNNMISIDSDKPQKFILQNFIGKQLNKNGDETVSFKSIDQNSKPCKIMFVFSNSGKSHQIYFIYNDFKYYYNFFNEGSFFD